MAINPMDNTVWQPCPVEYGWICPECGRIYSPRKDECYMCNMFDGPQGRRVLEEDEEDGEADDDAGA